MDYQGQSIKRVIHITNTSKQSIRFRISRTKIRSGLDRSIPLNEINVRVSSLGSTANLAAGLSTQIIIRITGRQIGKIKERITIHSVQGSLTIRVQGQVVALCEDSV